MSVQTKPPFTDADVLKKLSKPRTFIWLLDAFGWMVSLYHMNDALCRLKRDGLVIEVCELDSKWYYERTKEGDRHVKRFASKRKQGKKRA